MVKQPIMNKDTLVPLGVLVGILGAAISFTMYLNSKFSTLQDEIKDVKYRLTSYEAKNNDRWTVAHMKIFQLEMQQLNPSIKTPDPWEIVKKSATDTN
jgi:hypothetical protein